MDGKSRQGKELICVEIGVGSEVIAHSAGAHSNEPTGTVTAFHLISNLVKNPHFASLLEKYKFVVHPMLDPDGAELNYRSRHPGQLHAGGKARASLFSAKGNHQDRIDVLTKICEEFGVPVIDMDPRGQFGIERLAAGFLAAPSMAKMTESINNPEIVNQIRMPTYEYVEQFCGAPFCLIFELPSDIDDEPEKYRSLQRGIDRVKTQRVSKKKKPNYATKGRDRRAKDNRCDGRESLV